MDKISNKKTDGNFANAVLADAFSFNERVIWDSGFGYEIGYFLGEGLSYDTWMVDVRTGIIMEPTSYPKSEVHKYSNELIDKLTKKYKYKKRLANKI